MTFDRTRALCLAAAVGLAAAAPAGAAYTKAYNANPDNDAATAAPAPSNAAGGTWAAGGTNSGNVSKGAGLDGSTAYWRVTDTNTNVSTGAAENNSASYSVSYTPANPGATPPTAASGDAAFFDSIGAALPWQVEFTLRVTSSANPTLTPPSYNVPTVVDVRNGRRIYDLAFVNDGTNEGMYAVQTGTTFTASAATEVGDLDLDVFNTIKMVYTPNAANRTLDKVDVYLNGSTTSAFTFTDANSNASGAYRVLWGSGLSAATQTVHWNSITYTDVVPEPATLAALGLAGAAFVRRRRRA